MDRIATAIEGAGGRPRPLLLLVLILLVACAGQHRPLPRLLDGSHPPALPKPLRSLHGNVVATKVRVASAVNAGSRLRGCMKRFGPLRMPANTILVDRTGLVSAGITFAIGSWLYGCDATAGTKESPGPWCGGAVGRMDLPIFDPRLDILCRDGKGRALGLAWIVPVTGARYVLVRERGYAEAYEVAGGLPVRVATHAVDVNSSSASFRVEQYDAHGGRLERRTLHAVVAG